MGYADQMALGEQLVEERNNLRVENKNLKLEIHKLQKYKIFYESFSSMISNTQRDNRFGKFITLDSLQKSSKILFDQLCLNEINNGAK